MVAVKRDEVRTVLVEDNPGDIRLIEEMLGYPIHSFQLLDEAIEWLDKNETDIILLDLNLPDCVGLDTFRKMHGRFPGIPVVLLTGLEDDELVSNALRLGAQDFLVKGSVHERLLDRAIRYSVERGRADRALRESEERYSLAARGANDGIWDYDLSNDLIHFADRWKHIIGFNPAEIGNSPTEWFDRVHPEDREELEEKLSAHIDGKTGFFEHEYRISHRDGSYRWVKCRGMALFGEDGFAHRIAGSQSDIDSQKRAEFRLIRSSLYDGLTDLPNRVLFHDRLQHVVDRTSREPARFAVEFLDFDNFKAINDSYGHPVGDEFLQTIARRVKNVLRPTDTLARLSGDEFVILLEELETPRFATVIAERILEAVSSPMRVAESQLSVTASIGIVICDEHYSKAEEIIRDADTAMYQAKLRGRNRYEIFESNMGLDIRRRLDIETMLRNAISGGGLAVAYQPIVAGTTGVPRGVEALVRWRATDSFLVEPSEFIPVAEETGMVPAIDLWMLKKAGEDFAEWRRDRSIPDDFYVSVNISGRDFASTDFVHDFLYILNSTPVFANHLVVEITESSLLDSPDKVGNFFEALRNLGVRIALDDFGTGYSSLSYLLRYPFDLVKLDQSFVMNMLGDPAVMKIVRAVVRLSRDIELLVVAEGVETDEQAECLRSLGCELLQGFLFSRAVDADKLPIVLSSINSE